MAELPTTAECLRKQVLRQLLYRRYDKGVDLANIFALQLELFRVGDEGTKDTWRACKPFYLDYVGITEQELQSVFLNRPPALCTSRSRTDDLSSRRQYNDSKLAHPNTICPPSTNVQVGFVDHEMTGESKNVPTWLSEDTEGEGSVQILLEPTSRPAQDTGVILVGPETGHRQVRKDCSDIEEQVATFPEDVIAFTSILNVKAMGKVPGRVEVVQVYEANARPLAEVQGVDSWRYEALFVCRLACNMLRQESAQAESFLRAEDVRTKAVKLPGSSMQVSPDSRRRAERIVSPLRLQAL